jgi:pentatricopeptide repeat protein
MILTSLCFFFFIKTKEAIDFFFLTMIEKDRFKPTLYLYNILMKHLANVGYTHMVFSLFKRVYFICLHFIKKNVFFCFLMHQYYLKLTSSKDDVWSQPSSQKRLHQIVTILFSACSKSPWPEYSLRKTDSIRVYLKNRQITPNVLNYAAMISAYGRAGAVYEAFNTVDEMLENKIKPDVDVFSNLLTSCITQRDYGFKYALMVIKLIVGEKSFFLNLTFLNNFKTWQMSLKFKIRPDLYMFNLFLKVIKDCNIDKEKHEEFTFNPFEFYKKEKPKLSDKSNVMKNIFPEGSKVYEEFKFDEDFELIKRESTEDTEDRRSLEEKNFENQQKVTQKTKFIVNKLEENETGNQDEVLRISEENVHLIDEMKVAAQSLQKQIDKLEWWQDIRSNIDQEELKNSIKHLKNPGLRAALMEINPDERILNTVFDEKDIEKKLNDLVLEDLDNSVQRLKLIGGVEGFFDSMDKFKVKPNFKTFNTLIQVNRKFPLKFLDNLIFDVLF